MAIACDFRECQEILSVGERNYLRIDDKQYVCCKSCLAMFKGDIELKLFVEEALPAPHVEYVVPQRILPLPDTRTATAVDTAGRFQYDIQSHVMSFLPSLSGGSCDSYVSYVTQPNFTNRAFR